MVFNRTNLAEDEMSSSLSSLLEIDVYVLLLLDVVI